MPTLLSAKGEEHGKLREIANASTSNDFKHFSAKNKEKLEKQKKEDSKMVKARYLNHKERNNGKLEKPYCKYAGDPIQIWKFLSGNVYEVPIGLVNEVNNECKMKKRSETVDDVTGNIQPHERPGEQVHEFIPVSF